MRASPRAIARHLQQHAALPREKLLACLDECAADTLTMRALRYDERGESPHRGGALKDRRDMDGEESEELVVPRCHEYDFTGVDHCLQPRRNDIDRRRVA